MTHFLDKNDNRFPPGQIMNNTLVKKQQKKKSSTCTFVILKGKNAGRRCCDINPYCKNKRHHLDQNTSIMHSEPSVYISFNDLNKRLHYVSIYGSQLTNNKGSNTNANKTNSNHTQPKSAKLPLSVKRPSGAYRPDDITSNVCPYCLKTFSKKSNAKIHVRRNRCPKFVRVKDTFTTPDTLFD